VERRLDGAGGSVAESQHAAAGNIDCSAVRDSRLDDSSSRMRRGFVHPTGHRHVGRRVRHLGIRSGSPNIVPCPRQHDEVLDGASLSNLGVGRSPSESERPDRHRLPTARHVAGAYEANPPAISACAPQLALVETKNRAEARGTKSWSIQP